jgi:Transposase, Mutator family
MEGPVRAVIESMSGARLVHDTLELAGWDVQIADAQKVKGLAPLACKTDRIDGWVLAELSRRDLVPSIWLPSPEVRGVELTGENGLLTALVRQVLPTDLDVELTDHLGYESHAVDGRGSGNSRHGSYPKTVTTDVGPVDLRVPEGSQRQLRSGHRAQGQCRLSGLSTSLSDAG